MRWKPSTLELGAILLIIGLILGAWFGTWRERLRADVTRLSAAVGRDFFLSQRADLQYCKADYDAAHEALSAWLSQLEQTQPVNGEYDDPLMNPRGIAVDKMLALGRLALLQERRGQTAAAGPYWQRAEAEAKAAAWTDPTTSGIRSAIERLSYCDARPAAKTP